MIRDVYTVGYGRNSAAIVVKAVVLVEGESDRVAVETLAARWGRVLVSEGVAVVVVGGAHALPRVLRSRIPHTYLRDTTLAAIRTAHPCGG
jgi:hypothetical protein